MKIGEWPSTLQQIMDGEFGGLPSVGHALGKDPNMSLAVGQYPPVVFQSFIDGDFP